MLWRLRRSDGEGCLNHARPAAATDSLLRQAALKACASQLGTHSAIMGGSARLGVGILACQQAGCNLPAVMGGSVPRGLLNDKSVCLSNEHIQVKKRVSRTFHNFVNNIKLTKLSFKNVLKSDV